MIAAEFLAHAAERTGFSRDIYTEKNIPVKPDSITITPFFGDGASEYVLSALLHRRVKEQILRDRYWVVATHPGRAFLYPFADEVWGLKGEEVVRQVSAGAIGFDPLGRGVLHVRQELNKFFPNVFEPAEFSRLYDGGLTRYFFDRFNTVEVDLPAIISPRIEFARVLAEKPGKKAFLAPTLRISVIDQHGRPDVMDVPQQFWVELGESLLATNVTPVFQFGPTCHDVSSHFAGRAVYCTDNTAIGLTAAMRASGCVVSVFQDVAFLAAVARAPLVWYEDRRRRVRLKMDELSATMPPVPVELGFSFPAAIAGGSHQTVTRAISSRVADFLSRVDRDQLPTTAAQRYEVDLRPVRDRRAKRMGSRLFCVPKLVE